MNVLLKFSDMLPPQSIHPPALVKATSFDDLLQKPKFKNFDFENFPKRLKEEFEGEVPDISLEKRKELIKEALGKVNVVRPIKLGNWKTTF